MKKKRLVFIIFDSIENSVFQSQVLARLHRNIAQDRTLVVDIISYEPCYISQEKQQRIMGNNPRIRLIIYQRLPIIGKASLAKPIYCILQYLAIHTDENLCLIARGPIAGYVCRKALLIQSFFSYRSYPLTIQVRGLAAEELRFTTQHTNLSIGRYIYNCYAYYKLKAIEKIAYAPSRRISISYESVSTALKEYISDRCKTPPESITIAHEDIPKPLCTKIYDKNRSDRRIYYNFKPSNTVYCYSGSAKPWQCPQETIAHFVAIYTKNKHARLLILTTDVDYFTKLLAASSIDDEHYCINQVAPHDLTIHLCAADYGYLLRKNDIINWVSRPTKLLEYQAARLTVIHNDTIALLADTT